MSDAISVSVPISGTDRTMSFEAGKLAQLADGAVVARIGDTILLATATAARSVREGTDFFPLTVDIEERTYAAGKIPGSFFRREGKSSDQAILTCRLIDRPLRPSFPEGFRNEVHVVGTIVGADQVNPHDVLAINAASAALMISGIPFDGPIGAVRIAYTTEGDWIPHPTFQEGEESTFELVVAGRALTDDADSEIAIMMVEAGGTEKSWSYYETGAPKVTEEVLAAGLEASKQWIRESINLQRRLVEDFTAARGPIQTIPFSTFTDYQDDVWARVEAVGTDPIGKANLVTSKAERNAALDAAGEEIRAALGDEFADRPGEVKAAIRSLTKKLVRKRIVEEGVRVDGRGTSDIRPLSAEIDLFPTAHGSALFQRGETQVLNVTTLGMPRMNQLLDTITPVESKRYMHHYNFPPFSTGETGFMRGPKRREIGHGLLAERALSARRPERRGVPLHPARRLRRAGVERVDLHGVGLRLDAVADGRRRPDQGPRGRHRHGPGLRRGALRHADGHPRLRGRLRRHGLQGGRARRRRSPRCSSTPRSTASRQTCWPQALLQAKEARLAILGVMAGAIAEPRDHVATSAPKIVSMEIPIDKIGEVIGPKGKVINTLQQETGADIAVDDDGVVGTVTIGAKDGHAVEEARRRISLILDPPTAEVGVIYAGKVVNITKFGAFVNVLPGRDGLLHISKLSSLAGGKRINNVEDVLDARSGRRGPRGRHRPAGQGVVVPGLRTRALEGPRARARVGQRGLRGTSTPRRRAHQGPPQGRRRPSRTRSRPSWWPTWVTWDPAHPRPMPAAVTTVSAVTAGLHAVARGVVDRDVRPAERHPPGHRDHGGRPLGGGRLLGRHRVA